MKSKNLLEEKIKFYQLRINKTIKAFNYATILVKEELIKLNHNDPRRNAFAKYSFKLEEILNDINDLTDELNIYINHKDIITTNDSRVSKTIDMLSRLEDKATDILTTLQSIAIYLENLKKEA